MMENAEEPVSLRRSMDRLMADNQRADRARMDAILERMIGMEAALNVLRDEYDSGRTQTILVQEQQTHIFQKLTEFSARFIDHIEDEASERRLLNALMEKVTVHSERISVLDRLVWAVIGAGGVGAASAVGWAMNHVQSAAN